MHHVRTLLSTLLLFLGLPFPTHAGPPSPITAIAPTPVTIFPGHQRLFPAGERDIPSNRQALTNPEAETAYQAAWALGRAEDGPALEAILNIPSNGRRRAVLTVYRIALEYQRDDKPLPEDIEAIIQANLDNEKRMEELVELLGQRPYRSMEIFNYLYEKRLVVRQALVAMEPALMIPLLKHMETTPLPPPGSTLRLPVGGRALKIRPWYRETMPLTNTQLRGKEARLAALLPGLDAHAREKLYRILLERNHPPIVDDYAQRLAAAPVCSTKARKLLDDIILINPTTADNLIDRQLDAYWQRKDERPNVECIAILFNLASRRSRFQGEDSLYCGHWKHSDAPLFRQFYLHLLQHLRRKACLADIATVLAGSLDYNHSGARTALNQYDRLDEWVVFLSHYQQARIHDYHSAPRPKALHVRLKPRLEQQENIPTKELRKRLSAGNDETAWLSAWSLGYREDPAGLRQIIGFKDREIRDSLLAMYIDGYLTHGQELSRKRTNSSSRIPTLKPEIEKIIVSHLADAALDRLIMLAGNRRYESRELLTHFLYRHQLRQAYNCTHDQANATMFEALPQLDQQERGELVYRLAMQRYPPIEDYIARQAASLPLCSPDKTTAIMLLDILPRNQAGQIMAGVLKQFWQQAGDIDEKCSHAVLRTVKEYAPWMPADSKLYCGHHGVLKDRKVQYEYLELLGELGLPECRSDLYQYMTGSDADLSRRAGHALSSYDDPEQWETILRELEDMHQQGLLESFTYQTLHHQFRWRLRNRKGTSARHPQKLLARKFQAELKALRATDSPSPAVEEKEPNTSGNSSIQQELALIRKYADLDIARKSLNNLLAREYARIARIRFIDANPREAARLYESLLEQLPDNAARHRLDITYRLGDLYQHDLKDNPRAAEHYSRVLSLVEGLIQQEGDMDSTHGWLRSWLPQEIRFLRTGQPFSRSLTIQEFVHCGPMIHFNLLGAESPDNPLFEELRKLDLDNRSPTTVDEAAYRKMLARLPVSNLLFMSAARRYPLIQDADFILADLQRRDPGRYWTSCLLSLARHKPEMGRQLHSRQPWQNLEQVMQGFRQATGLDLEITRDYPLATPQETWQVFHDALLAPDRQILLSCLQGEARNNMEKQARALGDDELRQLARKSTFSMGSQDRESAEGLMMTGDGLRFRLYFRKTGGKWKITQFELRSQPHGE